MPASVLEWVGLGLLTIFLVVVAVVAVYLAAGLFQARSLIRREFTAYFLSPTAYVVVVVFLLATGARFRLTLDQLTAAGPRGAEFPMQFMFSMLPQQLHAYTIDDLLSRFSFWLVLMLVPPLLTMRLFAEERSTGTLEMLMTAPLRDWQLVLSKFVACYAFYILMWLPTLIYLPVLLDAGTPEWQAVLTPYSVALIVGVLGVVLGLAALFVPGGGDVRGVGLALLLGGGAAAVGGGIAHYTRDPVHILTWPVGIETGPLPVLATYLGMALVGAMFLALGLLVSSLVKHQLVAALVSVALGLLFIVTGFWRPGADAGSGLGRALATISVPQHFSDDFCRGLIDTRHLTLYVSVAVLSLFLTVRSLESRRWR